MDAMSQEGRGLGLMNSIPQSHQAAGNAPPKIMVALSASAADVLRCLFFHGPTWDGNVPSKSGRDELVSMGLAARSHGWQWLTRAGIDACFTNKIDSEKERRESREHARRYRLEEMEDALAAALSDRPGVMRK